MQFAQVRLVDNNTKTHYYCLSFLSLSHRDSSRQGNAAGHTSISAPEFKTKKNIETTMREGRGREGVRNQ